MKHWLGDLLKLPGEQTPEDVNWRYWDQVARRMEKSYYLPNVIAELRMELCLGLLRRWCGIGIYRQRILKTDAFEEAFAPTSALLELSARNCEITGIDISPLVVSKAREKARQLGVGCRFVACDVRNLPFGRADFDTVFSHSTLDHFPRSGDLQVSLEELARVLRPGGVLVLTLDNEDNFCAPLVRLARHTISPFYVSDGYTANELTRVFDGLPYRFVEASFVANSPRIIDIAMARVLGMFHSRSIDRLTKHALSRFDALLEHSQISRFFGTYVAVKAVRI